MTGTPVEEEPDRPYCGARCLRMSEAGLCSRCAYLLRRDLQELPDLWRMLSLLPGRTEQARVSGSHDMPTGLRIDVLSFAGPCNDDTRPMDIRPGDAEQQTGPPPLLDTLATWARLILEESYADPPAGHTLLVPWLLDHDRLGWACRQPWADDMAEEIRTAVATCRALAGAGWLTHRLGGVPCPTCGVCALTRENGEETVQCVSCWRTWSWDEYRWLTHVLAAEAKGAA